MGERCQGLHGQVGQAVLTQVEKGQARQMPGGGQGFDPQGPRSQACRFRSVKLGGDAWVDLQVGFTGALQKS